MEFQGRPVAFGSPAAAVEGMVARLASVAPACPVEVVPLSAARGRILARPVLLDRDSPAFTHSAMDGYAVRAADLSSTDGIARLTVLGEVLIGSAPPPLPEGGFALRIVTGAGLPAGADTVVRREDVDEHTGGDARQVVAISISAGAVARIRAGDHLRRRGENARAGDPVLEPGIIVSGAAVGALAAAGAATVPVRGRLRVALVTSGDELIGVEERPSEFQVRDSNSPGVGAVLGAHAWIDPVPAVRVCDSVQSVHDALRRAITLADAVVLTGGVSMGHRDPVRAALESLGAEVVFHGLPQRPGKPMLGALVRGREGVSTPVLALPGNPVSSLVTAARLAVPILCRAAGASHVPPVARVMVSEVDPKPLDLWWYRLVRIDERGDAVPIDGRGSGDGISAGRSDGFVEVPPGPRSHGPLPYYPWPF